MSLKVQVFLYDDTEGDILREGSYQFPDSKYATDLFQEVDGYVYSKYRIFGNQEQGGQL